MASSRPSDNRLITDALNLHGIFFKKKVREALETIKGIQVLGEEYPVSYLEGASLDLLIEYNAPFPGHGSYIIPIECKRGYAAVKRWIFFEDNNTDLKFFYILSKDKSRAIGADHLVVRKVPVCMEGVEIDFSKFNPKNRKELAKIPKPSSIWDAANQVCKGFLGFLVGEIESRAKILDSRNIDVPTVAVFPMLITTAPLSICEFSLDAIDISTGNHKQDIETREVRWLILKHPFTPSSTFGDVKRPLFGEGYVSPRRRGYEYKEGILIVNSNALADFFELVSGLRLD